ncbi:hypothetical protein Btru_042346 [Bulinus truncatus]|nr:hypothetical protein Btru_042346 [Bulinus truncatus]
MGKDWTNHTGPMGFKNLADYSCIRKGSAYLPYSNGGKNFQLCIEEQWTTDFTRVQELVDGHYRNISLPTKDSPSCTTSSNGNAALLISAPEELRYMIAFNYRIIDEKSTLNDKSVQPRKHQ